MANSDTHVAPKPVDPTAPAKAEVALTPTATWDCTTLGLNEKGEVTGSLSEEITVGQKFQLDCEGASVALQREKINLALPKKEKYKLRLLETKVLTENKASFVATSYFVGKNRFDEVHLTDGAQVIGLKGIEVHVKTVIDPNENPERQPYGPFAPLTVAWPLWLWLTIGAVVLVVGGFLFYKFRKSYQKKKLIQELARHGTALSPYNQFNKDMRRLSRQMPNTGTQEWPKESVQTYLKELNQLFRWYLARELIVPALQWGPGQILRDIRRNDRELYEKIRRDLIVALNEVKKALASSDKATREDCLQLTDLCRKVADAITRNSAGKKKGA